MKAPETRAPEVIAADWNAAMPPGSHVMFNDPTTFEGPLRYITTGPARVLCGHTVVVTLQGRGGNVPLAQCWPATVAQREAFAYCAEDGVVCFGDVLPAGMIRIASGPEHELRAEMRVVCRHEAGGLSVPNLRDAATRAARAALLADFFRWISRRGPFQRGVLTTGQL